MLFIFEIGNISFVCVSNLMILTRMDKKVEWTTNSPVENAENATGGKYDTHPCLSRANAGMRAVRMKGILSYYTAHYEKAITSS